MFKVLKRCFLLLLPYGVVRRVIATMRGVRHPFAQRGMWASVLLDCLPYFFAATLQQMKGTDKVLSKYFFPYGYMVDYLEQRHGIVLHEPYSKIQRYMPYGLVLWWEVEEINHVDQSKMVSHLGDDMCTETVSLETCQKLDNLEMKLDMLQKELRQISERDKVLLLRVLCLLQEYGSASERKVK